MNYDPAVSAQNARTNTALATPEGWPVPERATFDRAKTAALDALSLTGSRPAQERLAAYYDRAWKFAGSTFTDLTPNLADDIAAADLLAATTLSIEFTALDLRRLLEPSPERAAVLARLRTLSDGDLALADAETLDAMEQLYTDVKVALTDPWARSSDRWVTASKLCARKRPDLFPVRDRKVLVLLGLKDLNGPANYRVDWQVFRHLIRDTDVRRAILNARDAVATVPGHDDVRLDTGLLRTLDVALWTQARELKNPDGEGTDD